MSVRDCFSRYKGDKVCAYVNVRFIGMDGRGTRAKGNRTRGLMVPEARVSEVHELVAGFLKGLLEDGKEVDAGAGSA